MDKTNDKKITFLLSSFRAGGGERVMVDLANGFVRRGYNVDLAVLKPVGQYAEHVDKRVHVISLDAGRMAFSLPKLISYLRTAKPEVLLALDEYTHLLALVARSLSGDDTRIFLRIGNMLSELFRRYQGWKNKLLLPVLVKTLYKKADGIIANSRGVADDVALVTRIEKEKIVVIANLKDLEFIRTRAREEVEHPWLVHKTLPVVVAVARLREQKNYPLLVRAFANVVKDTPARLIIVGGGREEERLRTLVDELGLEDTVSFVGYRDNPHAYMGKADVFVQASLWEGLPNAVIEALVCGIPVIASDCDSGPREILAPGTDYRFRLKSGIEYAEYGALFAVNDESALTKVIIKFLNDKVLRDTYTRKSAERAGDFDAEKIIDEYARAMGVAM